MAMHWPRTFSTHDCVVHKEVTWNLSELFLFPVNEEGVQCPDFQFAGASWRMRIEPYPPDINKTMLFLMRKSPIQAEGSTNLVDWSIGVRYETGGIYLIESGKEDLSDRVYAWKLLEPVCILNQAEFVDHKISIFPLRHVTLFCVLRLGKWNCCHTTASPRTMETNIERLSSDFGELLSSGNFSDVRFLVQGKEFKAHKVILASRVPVFRAMFHHTMLESLSGTVRIDDCDPDIFGAFLHFVYTGSLHGVRTGDIFELYSVADKYQVDTLKLECVEMMMSTMTVHTFCESLALAMQHSEGALMDRAVVYFSRNMKQILPSDAWAEFITKNPLQANELLMRTLVVGEAEDADSDFEVAFSPEAQLEEE